CAITLFVMLLASIIYNNNPGFILTFLLSSMCLVSILHNFRSLIGLRVSSERGTPVFAGETAHYPIRLQNLSDSARLNIDASIQAQPAINDSIPARSHCDLKIPVKTSRRGRFNPGTVTLSSRYPLGLFRAWSPVNFSQTLLVYPKPAKQSLLPQASAGAHGQANNRSPDGDDFAGFKDYVAGDSLLKIHWKAYAKGQGLLVKRFSGEKVADLWLDLERTPGADLEERLSQLCRAILDADRLGIRYGLRLPGFVHKPGHGEAHKCECLKALALF
ncbi:MAG: DUF58 domain-containing protein, partial [Methylococcales bacterium]